jgi:ferredoxin-NADP reductase
LSKPEAQWPLCRGRVTDCLQMHDLPPQADYYLCGGKKMINDAKQILQQREVPSKNIFYERFS